MKAPTEQRLAIRDGDVMPSVSVVIVNYNGRAFLDDCLASLRRAFTRYRYEIIVVDNASSDGSREYLESQADVRLLASDTNLGFAAGNNAGVRLARGEVVLLLNNDTVCLGSLDPLIDCLADPATGIAGCALFYADGRVQPSVGFEHEPHRVVLSWLGLGRFFPSSRFCNRLVLNGDHYGVEHRSVDWVSGACLAVRTTLWQRLGGLDEAFFMYCEEVDLCRRARRDGFAVRYTPAAKVMHYEGSGRPWIGGDALRRTARSYLAFMRKHYGATAQIFVGVALGLVFLARSLVYFFVMTSNAAATVAREKCSAYRDAGCYLLANARSASLLEGSP